MTFLKGGEGEILLFFSKTFFGPLFYYLSECNSSFSLVYKIFHTFVQTLKVFLTLRSSTNSPIRQLSDQLLCRWLQCFLFQLQHCSYIWSPYLPCIKYWRGCGWARHCHYCFKNPPSLFSPLNSYNSWLFLKSLCYILKRNPSFFPIRDMQTPPSIPSVLIRFLWMMRNVLKRMNKQFSDFYFSIYRENSSKIEVIWILST